MKHRCFEITTPKGVSARINGRPDMSPATIKALSEMIDCVAKNPDPLPRQLRISSRVIENTESRSHRDAA